jgi:superfamily II DNA or RNA helicase
MIYETRPYQQRIIAKAKDNWRKGVKSQMIESPPGSGKSFVSFNILKDVVENSKELLGCESNEVGIAWMAMRKNLLVQAAKENESIGCPNIFYISMFDKDPVSKMIGNFKKIILNIDECHHDATDSAAHIHNVLKPFLCLGLSATPIRTDRMKLCFETTIKDAGFHTLIQDGYLSQFDQWMLNDFTPESVSRVYLAEKEKWGKSIIFFLTYDECVKTANILTANGIKCDIVTGETDRFKQLDDFESGKTEVLINMFVLTEGFDFCPLRTVFVRDSHNKGPTIQMSGRVLRKYPNKVANIVQSVKTKYPFTRVAKCRKQYVMQDNLWVNIGISDYVQNMTNIMIKRCYQGISRLDTSTLNWLKNKEGRKSHRIFHDNT